MFIVVRFGADEEELFNPDCAVKVLMNDIRKRCHRNSTESISLLDEKGKAIVKIPDMLSMEEATGYFTNRGSYILLKCEKDGDAVKYKPLLDDIGKELSGVLDSLTIGTLGKPIKSSHNRKSSRTPQPTAAKQSSGGRNRKK